MPTVQSENTVASSVIQDKAVPLTLFGGIFVLLLSLVSLDMGLKGVMLFTLGGLLGVAFLGFQYGFASAWRAFLMRGDSMGLANGFLLVGLCALVFIPATSLGLNARGAVAPVSLSLVVGSFMFGMGMQWANGCGSGVLFSFGGGSGRMLVALPFFVIGSVLGSFLLPSILPFANFGPVVIGGQWGDMARTLFNLVLIAGVGLAFYLWGRHRGHTLSRKSIVGSGVIALLCWAVFVVSGHPWGVTFGFTLWGAKLAQTLGVDVASFAFWQWAGPNRALTHSVLSDVSSLMNLGMILGAGMFAVITAKLGQQGFPPKGQLVAAMIGGLMMGIGARLAFGCNIGAFLGGVASGSLHGWIWFVVSLLGSWVGIQYRPKFGFTQ